MKLLARLYYWLIGWKTEGNVPPHIKKCVMVAAPHTSNWDGPIAITAFILLDIKARFLVKKELFKFPLNLVIKAFGGIPVNRTKKTNMVDSMVALFDNYKELVLLIPPEGTRGYVKEWKSGFYYVALNAGLPIMLGYLDYKRKIAGIGPAFYPTGDFQKDLVEIKKFYKTITPRYPEKSSLADN